MFGEQRDLLLRERAADSDRHVLRSGGSAPIEATVVVASDHHDSAAGTFAPRRGAALVMASSRSAVADSGARIEISADGASARLEPLGIDFTPVRLEAATADALAVETAVGPHAPDGGPINGTPALVEFNLDNVQWVNGHESLLSTTHVFSVDVASDQTTDDTRVDRRPTARFAAGRSDQQSARALTTPSRTAGRPSR